MSYSYMSSPHTRFYCTLALFCQHGIYSIHGLWRDYEHEDCHPEVHFEMSKLSSIHARLKEHWFSVFGTNESFWRHEYKKHGLCFKLTELEYFSKVLELFDAAMKRETAWIEKWKHGKNIRIHVNVDFEFVD